MVKNKLVESGSCISKFVLAEVLSVPNFTQRTKLLSKKKDTRVSLRLDKLYDEYTEQNKRKSFR